MGGVRGEVNEYARSRRAAVSLLSAASRRCEKGHRDRALEHSQARVRMDEVRKHIDNTWFAWIGETKPDSVFYYRIHSPVILIEFDHQTPAGLRNINPPGKPNREHVHAVVRTPNGNDYGMDLLRQHYKDHPHSH